MFTENQFLVYFFKKIVDFQATHCYNIIVD